MDALKDEKAEAKQPKLSWELGTAYDLMMSLEVLHNPEDFGLRASWAAGVRSRVPARERAVLEDSLKLVYVPITWLHKLPETKDAATALWALRQVPPEGRLSVLTCCEEPTSEYDQILARVADKRAWDESDLEQILNIYKGKRDKSGKKGHSKKDAEKVLDWWSRPGEFGELYLKALQSYYQEFFAEEERRIKPALQNSVERSQELAEKTHLPELIETLSQGVQLFVDPEVTELIFAPSYWITPLIIYSPITPQQMLLMYGARPADASLVPGEVVPDALLRALKALAEPTRLKIIRYLSQEPLSPAQLARRLRLRPPTVIHHLEVLRLAGLVRLNLEVPGERKYAARIEGLDDTFTNIKEFLQADHSL
jgi:DNA-binding transcriptional ArsR family regulator